MSRKAFQQGLNLYQEGRYHDALQCFTDALKYDVPNKYLILDSRSSTYLKLGETKKAIQDAKKTIEVAPDRWQGYARAARVFFQINKLDASLTMVDMALARLKEEDTKRRESLVSLKAEVEAAQQALEARRRLFMDHMGKLPIELFSEIASIVVTENQTSPIVLSHVSRHWRRVIHSLPRLWDALVLTKRRPAQKAKFWIEKSKGKIRELSIRSSVLDIPWAGNHLDLLDWGYLRVLKVQSWDKILSLGLVERLDSLLNIEHLETDGTLFLDRFPFFRQNEDPEESMSKLRHLSIILELNTFFAGPLGVHTLTSLTLTNLYLPHDILDILESNPQLEHLILQSVLQSVDSNSSRRKFVLPMLKTLSLRFFVPASISGAELPALEILRIDSHPAPSDLLVLFQTLVETNSNRLTELGIYSTPLPQEAIVPLLRISNALQALQVSNVSSLAPYLIEALAATDATTNNAKNTGSSTRTSPAMLCPLLTRVNFSSCPDVETGPLVRLVRSRLPNPVALASDSDSEEIIVRSKITSLVVDYCPRIESAWVGWLRSKVPLVSCIYMKKHTKFRAS